MPGKPSDDEGPLAEPPDEWEEAGRRELADDFLIILFISGIIVATFFMKWIVPL